MIAEEKEFLFQVRSQSGQTVRKQKYLVCLQDSKTQRSIFKSFLSLESLRLRGISSVFGQTGRLGTSAKSKEIDFVSEAMQSPIQRQYFLSITYLKFEDCFAEKHGSQSHTLKIHLKYKKLFPSFQKYSQIQILLKSKQRVNLLKQLSEK